MKLVVKHLSVGSYAVSDLQRYLPSTHTAAVILVPLPQHN